MFPATSWPVIHPVSLQPKSRASLPRQATQSMGQWQAYAASLQPRRRFEMAVIAEHAERVIAQHLVDAAVNDAAARALDKHPLQLSFQGTQSQDSAFDFRQLLARDDINRGYWTLILCAAISAKPRLPQDCMVCLSEWKCQARSPGTIFHMLIYMTEQTARCRTE